MSTDAAAAGKIDVTGALLRVHTPTTMAVEDRQITTPTDPEMALIGEYVADPESIRHAREAVAALARRHGVTGSREDDVRLAVSEAATNVVMHAYDQPAGGGFRVFARLSAGQLTVLIEDDGRGLSQPSQSPGLGAGLRVMAAVAEEALFAEREEGGSTVQLSFSLSGEPDASQTT